MRRIAIVATVILLAAATGSAADRPRDAGQESYRRLYVKRTFGKKALAKVGARAGIAQARRSPKEWGTGPAGFARRFGSAMATHVLKNSIQTGVAAIRHENLHYERSQQTGFGPRLKHALLSTVVTRKTTTGRKTVAAGRLSGAFGSGLISRAWQPAALRGVASGFTSGGVSLGADAAANVAREFWPRKKPRR